MASPSEEDAPPPIDEASDSGITSGGGSDDASDFEDVEWNVTTREKRSTAGNRLSSLIHQEAPDDDLELLFVEDEDDDGFEDVEADSDVQMDSSSDEDDQGPAATDDLEGEKELQKLARAEKLAKKKKENDGIPRGFKKRVKIDPTAMQAPPPRPKKKSERVSWMPATEDAPTRLSRRGTTIQSREELHKQMLDREIKRLKQLANMEKAAAAKEAAKKPAMTQEDRLAEAARVEKRNFKSLSRWEQAEHEREEQQKAKLAALNNRQLKGPVITWWSGKAEWVGGQLKKVGKNLELEDPKEKQSRKRKAQELEAESAASPASDTIKLDVPAKSPPADAATSPQAQGPESQSSSKAETPSAATPLPPNPQIAAPPLSNPYPPPHPYSSQSLQPPYPPPYPTPATYAAQPYPSQPSFPTKLAPPKAFVLAPPQQYYPPPALDGSSPLPGFGYNHHHHHHLLPPGSPFATTSHNQLNYAPPGPPPPPPPPAIEHAALSYVILGNFDEDAIKDKDTQTQILMNRKFPKTSKHKSKHEVCAITQYPAKFRDPATGLPYCNSYAYKEIQRLRKGDYKWSKLVGAYVGTGLYAARGVPPRFSNPKALPPAAVPADPAATPAAQSA